MHDLQVIESQKRLLRLGAAEVGRRIRAARLARKLSQDKLAKAIGLSQNSLQKIENGLTENSRFLTQIWSYLGLSLAELNAAFGQQVIPLPPVNDLVSYSGKAHLIASIKFEQVRTEFGSGEGTLITWFLNNGRQIVGVMDREMIPESQVQFFLRAREQNVNVAALMDRQMVQWLLELLEQRARELNIDLRTQSTPPA